MSKLILEKKLDIISAEKSDIAVLKNTLAQAFINDPMTKWTVKNDAKIFERMELMFETMIKHFGLTQGHVHTTSERNGCSVWVSPQDNTKFSFTGFSLIAAWLKIVGIERMPKILKTASILSKYHPKEECYYLMALGVKPEDQGKGIASQIITPVLELCDKEGISAYLETSNITNIGFYQKHGFEIKDEINEPDKLPLTWTMLRQPKAK